MSTGSSSSCENQRKIMMPEHMMETGTCAHGHDQRECISTDDMLQREALMGNSVRELTQSEIQAVRSGSRVVYIVLLVAAMSLSFATYAFLSLAQQTKFESEFHSYARETAGIAENNANNAFEQFMNLATAFTSYGLENTSSSNGFPNVTIPHFDIRAQSIVNNTGVDLVIYAPLVEDDLRFGWEFFMNNEISSHHHYHDDSYLSDMVMYHDSEPSSSSSHVIEPCATCVDIEDMRNGFRDVDSFMESILQQKVATRGRNLTKLVAPVAQYGPLPPGETFNLSLLMQDLMAHPIFRKEITAALEYNVPVISETLDVNFLLTHSRAYSKEQHESTTIETENTAGQQSMGFGNMLRSFTLDAVKESFEDDAKTVGFIVTILPWGAFFGKVLKVDPHNDLANQREINGLVVKVVSDCGGVFTYVMNGGKSDAMFPGDRRDLYEEFEDMRHLMPFFWKDHPKGLSKHCHFDLHLYPSEEFYSFYHSNTPIMYAGVIFAVFVFTAILFSFYDRYIFKRQRHVITHATALIIDNARRAAHNEREMNDFIAHEVRNPLAAALSACSFVSSTLQQEEINTRRMSLSDDVVLRGSDARTNVMEDLEIIDSSLHFINDLLRNLLDMQRASSKQMTIEEKPTHLMDDVFHPVSNMLHIPKGSDVKVELLYDAPDADDLVVMADSLRLKQILLNLARNSVKFVERGFIRLRARVVDDENPSTGEVMKRIELSVEDSGPGIPVKTRTQLFNKFQESLDSLHQGTGIGLNLCRKLSILMGANLYIDEHYESGVPGCPGTRFVLDLQKPPFELSTKALVSLSKNSECNFKFNAADLTLNRPIDAYQRDGCVRSDFLTTGTIGSSSVLDLDPSEESTENPVDEELPANLNVLFTDDDMVLRKLFSRSLKRVAPNWNIKEASNGETAIQLAQNLGSGDRQPFDLIFMDQYMASVNKQLLGTEATRALRAMGVSSIICGLSANDVEQAFLEAGANTFMLKPFPCTPDLLKAELVRILSHCVGPAGSKPWDMGRSLAE